MQNANAALYRSRRQPIVAAGAEVVGGKPATLPLAAWPPEPRRLSAAGPADPPLERHLALLVRVRQQVDCACSQNYVACFEKCCCGAKSATLAAQRRAANRDPPPRSPPRSQASLSSGRKVTDAVICRMMAWISCMIAASGFSGSALAGGGQGGQRAPRGAVRAGGKSAGPRAPSNHVPFRCHLAIALLPRTRNSSQGYQAAPCRPAPPLPAPPPPRPAPPRPAPPRPAPPRPAPPRPQLPAAWSRRSTAPPHAPAAHHRLVGLDVEGPALQHLLARHARDHQHHLLQRPRAQPLCGGGGGQGLGGERGRGRRRRRAVQAAALCRCGRRGMCARPPENCCSTAAR